MADWNQATDIDDPHINFSDQNDYETIPDFELIGEESPLACLERTSKCKMSLPVSPDALFQPRKAILSKTLCAGSTSH